MNNRTKSPIHLTKDHPRFCLELQCYLINIQKTVRIFIVSVKGITISSQIAWNQASSLRISK